MPDSKTLTEGDSRILALFESPGSLETATPGARAWLARDPASGKPVLLKRTTNGSSSKARATAALLLEHPNIVRTRRWLFEDELLYVVRDVVRGRNLKQALAVQGRTPETLQKSLLPIISALEVAHSQGSPHGGISAENILVTDEGVPYLSDFAAVDPKSPRHFVTYAGSASVAGDIQALARLLVEYLPTTGAFANAVVRGRIEGILTRADSLSDIRATLQALDALANAPVPRNLPPTGGNGHGSGGGSGSTGSMLARSLEPVIVHAPPVVAPPEPVIGIPPLPPLPEERDVAEASTNETPVKTTPVDEPTQNPEAWVVKNSQPFPTDPPVRPGMPRLTCMLAEKQVRLAQGETRVAVLSLANDGDGTLIVRMIATQHAWLNVRPVELPLTLPPGTSVPVEFMISAARLAVGDYRSEVYLSANASGKNAEDLRGGWFKHTSEMRVSVDPLHAPAGATKPPYPAHAPKLPAQPGCGILVLGAILVICGTAVAAMAATGIPY